MYITLIDRFIEEAVEAVESVTSVGLVFGTFGSLFSLILVISVIVDKLEVLDKAVLTWSKKFETKVTKSAGPVR